jgi:hypothetical protein
VAKLAMVYNHNKIKGLSIIFGVFLGFVVLSLAIPQYMFSDGLDRYVGAEQKAAFQAAAFAHLCFAHPIERPLKWKIQVMEVMLESRQCPKVHPSIQTNYSVLLRSYTFFGIPTANISVSCGEVVCGRSFQ